MPEERNESQLMQALRWAEIMRASHRLGALDWIVSPKIHDDFDSTRWWYLDMEPLGDKYIKMKLWGWGFHNGIGGLPRKGRDTMYCLFSPLLPLSLSPLSLSLSLYLPLCHVRTELQRGHWHDRKRVLTKSWITGALILDFQIVGKTHQGRLL